MTEDQGRSLRGGDEKDESLVYFTRSSSVKDEMDVCGSRRIRYEKT